VKPVATAPPGAVLCPIGVNTRASIALVTTPGEPVML
jgi:hypothetical protein